MSVFTSIYILPSDKKCCITDEIVLGDILNYIEANCKWKFLAYAKKITWGFGSTKEIERNYNLSPNQIVDRYGCYRHKIIGKPISYSISSQFNDWVMGLQNDMMNVDERIRGDYSPSMVTVEIGRIVVPNHDYSGCYGKYKFDIIIEGYGNVFVENIYLAELFNNRRIVELQEKLRSEFRVDFKPHLCLS